jgi:hypothetical protein
MQLQISDFQQRCPKYAMEKKIGYSTNGAEKN